MRPFYPAVDAVKRMLLFSQSGLLPFLRPGNEKMIIFMVGFPELNHLSKQD